MIEEQSKQLEQANVAPRQSETFRIGAMLGQKWGVYAVSKFGGNPVLVFTSTSESGATKIAEELNNVVSNNSDHAV